MSEIKDYGEPWSYNKDRTPSLDRTRPAYQDRDGKTIPGKSTYADDGAVRDRALACVNALAGRDPEKLDALLEAAKALYEDSVDRTKSICASWAEDYGKGTYAEEAFRAALAAFEGGSHE